MKAAVALRYGPPEVVEIREVLNHFGVASVDEVSTEYFR